MERDTKKLKRSESFYDQESRRMEDVLMQEATSVAEKRKISLSESSILGLDATPSTASVASGNNDSSAVKKPRKFKPKKFIAKHFKTSKKDVKSDERVGTPDSDLRSSSPGSATGVQIVEKPKSPKLQAKKIKGSLIKTFSIKKKHRVGPESTMDPDDQNDSNIKRLAGLNVSQESVCEYEEDTAEGSSKEGTPENVGLVKDEPTKPQRRTKSVDEILSGKEKENPKNEEIPKKSQIQITISGKKIEKVPSKVSSRIQFFQEGISLQQPNNNNNNIIEKREELKKEKEPIVDEGSKNIQGTSLNVISLSDSEAERNVQKTETEMKSSKPISSANIGEEKESDAKNKPVILKTIEKQEQQKEEEKKRKSLDEKILEAIKESENNLQKLLSTSPLLRTNPASFAKPSEIKEVDKDSEGQKEKVSDEKESELKIVKEKSVEKEIPKVVEEKSSGFMKKFEKKSKKNSDKKNDNKSKNAKEKDPTVRVQEARQPYHVNFKSASMDELKDKPEKKEVKVDPPKSESPTIEINPEDIKFNIGTSVRPLRTSSSNAGPPIPDMISMESAGNISQEGSLDANSQHSPKSDKSGSSRRRIAYVPQMTVYTPEEQELLKASMNRELSDSFDIKSPTLEDDSLFPFPNCQEPMDTMTQASPEKREHLYKILVIGELGTGKTSFIKRYVHQFFSQNYRATIGVDFALKVLNWDQNTTVRLQLWDIAGQERFGNMTRVYYKEAVGAFIVFDVTRSATFDAVIKWKQDLDSKVQLPDGSPIPCILLANKCDQQKQGIVTTPAKLDEYCRENNFAGWFETSAKDNINIEESAKALVSKILINDKLINSGEIFDNEKFGLDGKDDRNGPKKFCSC